MEDSYDVVVVGGGAAGLGGALTLSRARRSVLVIDAGAPRNAPAGHIHNYLGREGTPPGELLAIGREEVAGYGGEIVTGTVTSADKVGDGQFRVTLADGATVRARRLLVTTGLVDVLPDVPGVAERWGRDVLHCPYCHGWEVRDQPVGVLAGSPLAVHQALMWRQWTENVTLFLNDANAPTGEEYEHLAARGIAVIDGGADHVSGHLHLGRVQAQAGEEVGAGPEQGCDHHGGHGEDLTRALPDPGQPVALHLEPGHTAVDHGDAACGELLVLLAGGFVRVVQEQRHVLGPLPPHQRLVHRRRTAGEDADRLVSDLPAVAVRAVQDVASPSLGHPGDVGEHVDEAGGHQQSPRPYGRAVRERHPELAVPDLVGGRDGAGHDLAAVPGDFFASDGQ